MNIVNSTLATVSFEIRRSLSIQRVMVASILAGFPPAMVTVIGFSGQEIPLHDMLILTLVSIVAILAQLLWATPNVYTELEAKSWIFLASRPRGRIALFLGKYLSAVAFSFAVCFGAITLCLILRTYIRSTEVNPFSTWLGMIGSALICCLTYSAIFSLIGTIFNKRAMVFGAAYIILSEVILANVPAIISNFTARFHLQLIAAEWIGWFLPIPQEQFVQIYGESSFGFHFTCIIGAILFLLVAGCIVVTSREFITSDET